MFNRLEELRVQYFISLDAIKVAPTTCTIAIKHSTETTVVAIILRSFAFCRDACHVA